MILKKILYLVYIILIHIAYSQILYIKPLLKYMNILTENIQKYYLTIYSKGFNSDIYYSGDIITFNEKIDIFISNHYNLIDFMINQGIFKKLNSKELSYLYSKYMDKLPLVGNAFKYDNSLALNKKIHLDIDNIKNYIKKNNNIVIYLNPEGTRINNKKLNKSKEYSKNNNLPIYNNLLFPKMKGLFTIINELAKQDKLGNIIDFTVKIENTTKNDNHLRNILNKDIGNTYLKINTYKCPHISDYDKFKKWFLMIWDKKEEYLNDYNNEVKYKYNKLDTELDTSIKIITILFIFIFVYISYFLYLKKNYLKNNILYLSRICSTIR